ncbi:FAD-dependent oxidoreductase [Verrucomicrobia bacterium]|nr:FAD-dependent oxidoreductase [Verrucomicrobiota bacterium]
MMFEKDKTHIVNIVGAGIAGLTCAHYLKKSAMNVCLYEASGNIGGRMQTEDFAGYKLDHGFHVLLTAYPEVKSLVNYKKLNLAPFYTGAWVRYKDCFHLMSDPFRNPLDGVLSLTNPIGTVLDKVNVGLLRTGLRTMSSYPDSTSTADALDGFGFSASIKERFLAPFLRAVFLEPQLCTSIRKFDEVFKNFANGEIAVPSAGISSVPKQLGSSLSSDELKLNSPVKNIKGNTIELESGQKIESQTTVLAVEGRKANHFTGASKSNDDYETGVACLYFGVKKTKVPEAILILNGTGMGPVNNLSIMPEDTDYAPDKSKLVVVSVVNPHFLDKENLKQLVVAQLEQWYGIEVRDWRYLKTHRIKNPIPCPAGMPQQITSRVCEGLYRCGDYMGVASLNTAIKSGRKAAEAILEDS